MSIDTERNHESIGKYIGQLRDMGLGNPEGIGRDLPDVPNALREYEAESGVKDLVDVADRTNTACIDGRHTINNADGSPCAIRFRRVGGSASNLGVAMNARCPLVSNFASDITLGEMITAVDSCVGYRSAHLGGCGGALGEIKDHYAIAEKSAIMDTVKALMSLPEVAEYFGVVYEDKVAALIRSNAVRTAATLISKDWDGQKYVDGVVKSSPSSVENLAVDEDDHAFHGHNEKKFVIIIGDKTLDQDDAFVWNLKATKDAAESLSGGDYEAYQRAIIAEMAKHIAVADRLASGNMPIELLSS